MKYCHSCHQKKSFESFARNKARRDGVQTYCRQCKAAYDSKFYKNNRAAHKLRVKEYSLKNKKRLWEYLEVHPCIDCGESNPVVLEFDHVRGKKRSSISYLIRVSRCSWETVQKELNKCVVRCANCHRRKTALQFKWKNFSGA